MVADADGRVSRLRMPDHLRTDSEQRPHLAFAHARCTDRMALGRSPEPIWFPQLTTAPGVPGQASRDRAAAGRVPGWLSRWCLRSITFSS
jgi:hypothetical protein